MAGGTPSQRDILAELMQSSRQTMVPHLAEMLKRDGVHELDASEERRRFWQRAVSPEDEQQLWQSEMANRGLTALTPEQAVEIGLGISQKVYPTRWDMATAEGRDHQSDVALWAWKHAKAGDPNARTEQPAPAPQPEEPS